MKKGLKLKPKWAEIFLLLMLFALIFFVSTVLNPLAERFLR